MMQPIQYDLGASPCVAAFRSLRAGKGFFMWMILLMLLLQGAAFSLVHFVGVLDDPPAERVAAPEPTVVPDTPTEEAAAVTATETPDEDAAAEPADDAAVPESPAVTEEIAETVAQEPVQDAHTEAIEQAGRWKFVFAWLLPATKFLALVLGLLAVLTFMFAVKLAIVGRLGGIAGFMSAFFWSLVLLAFVTPWQQVLGNGSFAAGALYNLGDLERERQVIAAETASLTDSIVFYARFIAYPALTVLVWILVMAKFAGGFRDSIMVPPQTFEMRPSHPAPASAPLRNEEDEPPLPIE